MRKVRRFRSSPRTGVLLPLAHRGAPVALLTLLAFLLGLAQPAWARADGATSSPATVSSAPAETVSNPVDGAGLMQERIGTLGVPLAATPRA